MCKSALTLLGPQFHYAYVLGFVPCRLGSSFTYDVSSSDTISTGGGEVQVIVPGAKYITADGYTDNSPNGVVHVVGSVMTPFSLTTYPINLAGVGAVDARRVCCSWLQ